MSNKNTYLSAYWVEGKRKDLTAENTSAALKFSSTALNYLYFNIVPVDREDTHILISGGANSLSLAGYSNRDIKNVEMERGGPLRSIY